MQAPDPGVEAPELPALPNLTVVKARLTAWLASDAGELYRFFIPTDRQAKPEALRGLAEHAGYDHRRKMFYVHTADKLNTEQEALLLGENAKIDPFDAYRGVCLRALFHDQAWDEENPIKTRTRLVNAAVHFASAALLRAADPIPGQNKSLLFTAFERESLVTRLESVYVLKRACRDLFYPELAVILFEGALALRGGNPHATQIRIHRAVQSVMTRDNHCFAQGEKHARLGLRMRALLEATRAAFEAEQDRSIMRSADQKNLHFTLERTSSG